MKPLDSLLLFAAGAVAGSSLTLVMQTRKMERHLNFMIEMLDSLTTERDRVKVMQKEWEVTAD